MKKAVIILVVAISSVLLLTIVNVIVANRLTTSGVSLAALEKDIENYKKQNALMQEDILMASSLTEIASKAAQLGFVQETSSLTLSSKIPVVMR